MTVRVYYSTDAGAPALSGTVGSLIALLDACLVNGYGAKPAAGWSKAFTGANLAAYRQPAGSNQMYLRADDTGATETRVVGYETMSDVNTGVNAFPTNVQISGGLYIKKSSTADAVSRPWVLITNGRLFVLHVNADSSVNSINAIVYAFGDITSYVPADAYETVIIAGTASAGTTVFQTLAVNLNSSQAGQYLARSYTQVGGSVTCNKHSDMAKLGGGVTMGASGFTYPNPLDGGLHMAPLSIVENNATIARGELPGVWCPLHIRPLGHLDTFSGTGLLAGKTFLALNVPSAGQMLLETSDTW